MHLTFAYILDLETKSNLDFPAAERVAHLALESRQNFAVELEVEV